LLQLQGTILKLIGIESGEANMAAAVTGNVAKLANREAAAGSALVEVGTTLAAEAYMVMFGSGGPTNTHANAALKLQKVYRGKMGRIQVQKKLRLLLRMQAFARAMLARKFMARLLAARWIQAHARSMAARSHVSAFSAVKLASWAAAGDCFDSRPGFAWVMRQEALHMAKDRAERINRARPLTASRLSFPRLSALPGVARANLNPKPSLPRKPSAEVDELTESSESDSVGEALPRSWAEHHGVAGVVFVQQEALQRRAARSLHVAVSASRREIARSKLPADLPPADFDIIFIYSRGKAVSDALLDAAEKGWAHWIKPALVLFLGHAFVGTQTFPPRTKRPVGFRRARSMAKLREQSTKRTRQNEDADDCGDGGDGED